MRRNINLDALRGLLASWVVVVHAFWFAGVGGGWLAASARMTVDAFIVLSGYLIAKSLITRPQGYCSFITERLRRLAPAFLVALAFAIALRPITGGKVLSEGPREINETVAFLPHLFAHLSLLFGLVPQTILPESSVAFLPPAWSISLEMQLYLLAPLLLWTVKAFGQRMATIGLAVSSIALVPQVAWRLHDWISPMGASFPQKLCWFSLGICFALGNELFWDSPFPPVSWPGTKTLAKLGTISYSLYLIHYPVLHVIRVALPGTSPLWACVTLQLAIGGPVSIGLAYLLYTYVERPCNRKTSPGRQENQGRPALTLLVTAGETR